MRRVAILRRFNYKRELDVWTALDRPCSVGIAAAEEKREAPEGIHRYIWAHDEAELEAGMKALHAGIRVVTA
jgi:hypothetical protein